MIDSDRGHPVSQSVIRSQVGAVWNHLWNLAEPEILPQQRRSRVGACSFVVQVLNWIRPGKAVGTIYGCCEVTFIGVAAAAFSFRSLVMASD